MRNLLLGSLLLGWFCSCSTAPTSSTSLPVVTSPQLTSEQIEEKAQQELREQALRRYQEMRMQNWDKYVQKKKATVKIPPRIPDEVPPRPVPTPAVENSPAPLEAPTIVAPPDPESEIIADQRIRFHCSAHIPLKEKEQFEKCLMQGLEIWNDCKESEFSTYKALSCLKQGL